MNIIILTGRFGMGHIKAAEAIREEILRDNEANNVEIMILWIICFQQSANIFIRDLISW